MASRGAIAGGRQPADSRERGVRRKSGPARDFLGYGDDPPHARWPGEGRIALNFNLNVEAGGEHSILDGDSHSENLLTDIGFPPTRAREVRWSNPCSNTDRASAAGACCASSSAST